jgi:hypothetical protein
MQWQNLHSLAVNNVTIEPYYKFHVYDEVMVMSTRQPHCVNSKPTERETRLTSN